MSKYELTIIYPAWYSVFIIRTHFFFLNAWSYYLLKYSLLFPSFSSPGTLVRCVLRIQCVLYVNCSMRFLCLTGREDSTIYFSNLLTSLCYVYSLNHLFTLFQFIYCVSKISNGLKSFKYTLVLFSCPSASLHLPKYLPKPSFYLLKLWLVSIRLLYKLWPCIKSFRTLENFMVFWWFHFYYFLQLRTLWPLFAASCNRLLLIAQNWGLLKHKIQTLLQCQSFVVKMVKGKS